MSSVRDRAKRLRDRHSALIGSVISVKTPTPSLVLTFDDGPDPRVTPDILSLLADTGASATFFALMTRARRYPSLVREIAASGHQVALHGMDHRALTTMRGREVTRRTCDGRAELEDIVGAPVTWMRPPYGRQRLSTWIAIRQAGLVPVFWGASTWDTKHLACADRQQAHDLRVAHALEQIRDGCILLAHDGVADAEDGVDDPAPPDIDRPRIVRDVLTEAAVRGLRGVSLSEALVTGQAVKAARFRS